MHKETLFKSQNKSVLATTNFILLRQLQIFIRMHKNMIAWNYSQENYPVSHDHGHLLQVINILVAQ